MSLQPSDVAHRHLALTGFLELALSREIRRRARGGGLLLDVGANAGYFTLLWLAGGRENRVIAFEAAPRPLALLRENLSRNGLVSRVRLIESAAGSRSGRMAFDPGPAEQASWGGLSLSPGEGALEVDVVRLDDVVPPEVKVEVLKVDVEGADFWVLEGAKSLLASGRVEVVFFEQNLERMQRLGIDPEAPRELLERSGYRVRPLPGTRRSEWMALRTGLSAEIRENRREHERIS
jgi:FkbM family methyltransferase